MTRTASNRCGGLRRGSRRSSRGMSTLLSLVTAITVLTIVLSGTLIVVEDAFRESQRDDVERAVAIQTSDRLVSAGGPIADRSNVVNASALSGLDAAALRALGAGDRFEVAVALDGDRLVAVGEPAGGHVVRRIVLVERTERVTRTPTLGGADEATLPVRTDAVELTLTPPANTTVTAVGANGRVVLANPSGLAGTHTIETARYETLTLSFPANGTLDTGDVTVAYGATNRERAMLAVTVDDTAATPRGASA